MTTQTPTKSLTNKKHLTALLASSVLITLILFYLDEGYYNFNWMTIPGNWILFVVYVALFFFSQFVVSKFLLKKQKGLNKTIYSIIVGGITLAIIILIFAIFNTS